MNENFHCFATIVGVENLLDCHTAQMQIKDDPVTVDLLQRTLFFFFFFFGELSDSWKEED